MFNKKSFFYLFILFSILLFLPSCDMPMDASMDAGVTPGGSQDNSYARDLIDNGIVPSSDAFTYEGAFSEHDFFINTNGQCNDIICIETVLSKYTPIVDEGNDRYIAQLIMTSNIDASTFKHEAIDLFIVLDKSGSMEGERFEKSKEAIKSIINKLRPEDSLGLINFNDTFTIERELSEIADNKEIILRKVDNFFAGGGTDIESALEVAYQKLHQDGKKDNKRIILITDARPNVNATGESEFIDLIRDYENETGLTVFGVGINFGQALTKAISETLGGNYIFLPNISDIDDNLNDNFEFLISPIANNFNLTIKSVENFNILNSYGLPESNEYEIVLNAKTLFLSKSKGAIAIEFEYHNSNNSDIIVPMNDEEVFSFDWSYDNLDNVKFEKSETTYFSPFTTTSGNYEYTISGSEKLPLLVNMITVLKKSCDLYAQSEDREAINLLEKLVSDLDSINLILNDEQIQREAEMVVRLKSIMLGEYNSY